MQPMHASMQTCHERSSVLFWLGHMALQINLPTVLCNPQVFELTSPDYGARFHEHPYNPVVRSCFFLMSISTCTSFPCLLDGVRTHIASSNSSRGELPKEVTRDKVTDYLVKILKMPYVQWLESCEQLGIVILTTYLRPPDFAEYVFQAFSQQRLSLLAVFHQFFRDTQGVGQRKAYMPTRVISKHGRKLRPNRDLGKLRLAGALGLCGQFLDGTLDVLFVNDSKKSWLVDPDLLLGISVFHWAIVLGRNASRCKLS